MARRVTSSMERFTSALLTRVALLAVVLIPVLSQGGHVGAQALGAGVASATAHSRPDSAIHVAIDGAGLRIEVRYARPADVLQTLGAQSRVPITVQGELPGRITRTFTAASVEDAVREVI